ncbi:restriction endonuclease subunit S [Coraliomargarita algicola]|uniref:Restriction endonuclease subunit S n=1 Tax=Coraliomargarita algicola TaxID=3092156 RepID=A0ABZ0RPS1_9BACT|nr:restriction endonuclease subunit S [Coraliomargarita sp. J2-16]WPJ96970.1 restriction endonuclease subunit S [Coraliomargarita sp. J2-16]
MKTVKLSTVLKHRSEKIKIDDATNYKLVRIRLHRKGVMLRHKKRGAEIRTKTQQLCKAGDFIVAEMDAKVGGYGFIPTSLEGAIVSSHYYLYEVNKQKLLPSFLNVICQAGILQEQIVAKGSTNYASVRAHTVLDWTIPLPSLEDQKRIARQFDEAEDANKDLEKEIAHQQSLLGKLKQAILQEAIQGKLTADWRAANQDVEPASELLQRIQAEKARLIADKKIRKEKPLPKITPKEIPFEIPEGWEWCRLGDLTKFVTSGSRGWKAYYANQGSLFIRAQNIKTDLLDLSQTAFVKLPDKMEGQRTRVQPDDILVTITGGNCGKTARVDQQLDEAYVSQHIALTRLMETELSVWIHRCLTTDSGPRGVLLSYSKGDKPGLNLPNVRTVPIPLPPSPSKPPSSNGLRH